MSRKKQIVCMLFVIYILILLFAPRQNILSTDVVHTFAGSSREHILGTDNLGRDVYSLILAGGIRTLEVVFLSSAISFFVGAFLGMAAAFANPLAASLIQFAADFTLIIPSFIMAMIFSSLFGFSPLTAGIIFGIGNMGEYMNQACTLTQSLKNQEFIDGERVVGLGNLSILVFHVFPNIYRQLLIFLGNKAGNVTVQYAGLAFIGLGTDITNPDWGTLLYQYRAYLTTDPRLVLYPALAIAIMTIFFHILFDGKEQGKEEMTIYD